MKKISRKFFSELYQSLKEQTINYHTSGFTRTMVTVPNLISTVGTRAVVDATKLPLLVHYQNLPLFTC